MSISVKSIDSEKNVSIDDVVREACAMYKQYKIMKINMDDEKAIQETLETLRKKHRELCEAYPIMLRYMVQLNLFHAKPFREYLHEIQRKPYTTSEEYIAAQADYIVRLYKHKIASRKYTSGTALDDLERKADTDLLNKVEEIRAAVIVKLTKEHEMMKENVEKLSADLDERAAQLKQQKIKTIEAYIEKHGKDIIDIPIVTKTDLPTTNTISRDTIQNMLALNAYSPTQSDAKYSFEDF